MKIIPPPPRHVWLPNSSIVDSCHCHPVTMLSNQKQPSCKKRCGPHKGHGEKRCEIQGGGQEMAVMVG